MENSIWDHDVPASLLTGSGVFDEDNSLFANVEAWDDFLVKGGEFSEQLFDETSRFTSISENETEESVSAGSEPFFVAVAPPGTRHQRMKSAALTAQPLVPMAHFDGPDGGEADEAGRAESHFATLIQKVPSLQDLSQLPITPEFALQSPLNPPAGALPSGMPPQPPAHLATPRSVPRGLPVSAPVPVPSQVAAQSPALTRTKASPQRDEKPKPAGTQRRRMTEKQTALLEASFQRNPRPDVTERERLTTAAGLQMRTVQIWFQNRRAKAKARKQPSQHYDMVRHLEQKLPSSVGSPGAAEPLVHRAGAVSAPPGHSLSTAGAAAALNAAAASPRLLASPNRVQPDLMWGDLASPLPDYSLQSPGGDQWARQSRSLLQSPYTYENGAMSPVGGFLGQPGPPGAVPPSSAASAAAAALASYPARPAPLNRSQSTSVLPGYAAAGDSKRRKDSQASLLPLRSGQTTPQSRVSPLGSPRAFAPRATAAPLDARVAANLIHQQQQHRRQRSYTQPTGQAPVLEDEPMRLSLDLNSSQARLVWVPARKDGMPTAAAAAAAAAAASQPTPASSATSFGTEPWPAYAPRTPSLGSHLGWPAMPPNVPSTAPSSRRDSVVSLFSLEEEALGPALSPVHQSRRVSRPTVDSVPEEECQFLRF